MYVRIVETKLSETIIFQTCKDIESFKNQMLGVPNTQMLGVPITQMLGVPNTQMLGVPNTQTPH